MALLVSCPSAGGATKVVVPCTRRRSSRAFKKGAQCAAIAIRDHHPISRRGHSSVRASGSGWPLQEHERRAWLSSALRAQPDDDGAEESPVDAVLSKLMAARQELEDLTTEQQEAEARGNKNASKVQRFLDTASRIEGEAAKYAKQGNNEMGRRSLEQRNIVRRAAKKAESRAEINKQLAAKLQQRIGSKEVEIIALLTQARELLAEGNGNEGREEDQKQQAPDGIPGSDSALRPSKASPEDMNEEELNDTFLQMRRDSLESLLSSSPSMSDATDAEAPTLAADEGSSISMVSAAEKSSAGGEADCLGEDDSDVLTQESQWWTLGLAAMQEGMTLRAAAAPEAAKASPLVDGGAGRLDAEADAIMSRMVNARNQGLNPKAADMFRLVEIGLGLSSGTDPKETGSMVDQEEDRERGLAAIAKRAGNRPAATRAALFASGAEEALRSSMGGESPQSCRGFVVALAAVLGLGEADATAAMDKIVAVSLKSHLLSVAADLRQGVDQGSVQAAVSSAARMLNTFPPACMDRLVAVVEDAKPFIPQAERVWLHGIWREATKDDVEQGFVDSLLD